MRKRTAVTGILGVLIAVASASAETTDFIDMVKTGTVPGIQAAINRGANVKGEDQYGMTALMWAAAYNPNPAVIALLLKAGSNIKSQDKVGMTALMQAARNNPNAGVVTSLLRAGADVKVRDKDGETALTYAAWVNSNPEVISVLLGAGADIKTQDRFGMTALTQAAAANQSAAVIAELLKAGADMKTQDRNGMTALMHAARYNPNPEVFAVLLKAGADAKAKSKEGKTALGYAQENEKLKGTDTLKRMEDALIVAQMVRHGTAAEVQGALRDPGSINPKAGDLTGIPWLIAAAQDNPDAGVVSLLAKSGANVNAVGKNGLTALMAAASSNRNPEVLSSLLSSGADVNAKDMGGDTALIFAGLNPNPQAAFVLLKAGADVNAKDTNGKSARDFATSKNNVATYQQLVEAAQPNWLGLHSMDLNLSLDDIYPVFHTYYDNHPLGSLALNNTTGLPITGIKVSFQIKEFMSDPKDCPAPSALEPHQSRSVDLLGLFLPSILQTTEKTKAQARVELEYAVNGQVQHQSLVQSIPILNRNATSWTDNRRAAAFVTLRDPVVLAFSRNVNSMLKGKVQGDPTLFTAIALFQALQLYGLTYSQDPIPTSTSNKQVADFIQFPRETLQYKGGKCSDFFIQHSLSQSESRRPS